MPKESTSPDIYIIHAVNEAEKALARNIVDNLGKLSARPVLLSAAELVARYRERTRSFGRFGGILPGTVIGLFSESMLRDSDQRTALLSSVEGTSIIDFRHHFICLGITPQEVQRRFPDLAPIYENVMLRSESELESVIQDVRSNFSQRIPGFWEVARPGYRIALGMVVALLLAQLGRIYGLRLILAGLLAVMLYMRANQMTMAVVLAISFFAVGLGLNRIDPLDLWPWLGTRWKWPASLDSLHSPRPAVLGPLVFTSTIFGGAATMITGNRTPLGIGLIVGIVLQAVTDALCESRGMRRLRAARARYPSDLAKDGRTCDSGNLREALRSCLIVRNFDLTVVGGSLVILLFVSLIAAARFTWIHGFVWLATLIFGAISPSISAASFAFASGPIIRLQGLTDTHLSRIRRPFEKTGGRRPITYAQGIDDVRLPTFAQNEEERKEFLQFPFLQRIPAAQSLRLWFTPPDFAFISYVWVDAQNCNTAELLDLALTQSEIPHFRDIQSIADRFDVWRKHVAVALASCTHFFLVVSPGIRLGQVVHREVETAIQRLSLEMLPAVICVVNPEEAHTLLNDYTTPLPVRVLLASCPQITTAEAADPRLVRYIVEQTRRQGKWNDWLTMLSPAAARERILRMPGLVREKEES